ncbi:MAG: iron-containing alcohol dehydrogenase [Bulleidia sp.]
MNTVLKCACRIYQTVFRIALPVLPYREPKVVDSCHDLKEIFQKQNITSVFVVSDRCIVSTGLVNPLLDVMDELGMTYIVYDEVRPNPSVENVETGLTLYRENGCQAIIAVGGGSVIDCGKAIGARVVNPKRTLAQMKGILRVFHSLPPLFAIPTTAGTGSEVTLAAVITDPKTHDKYALMDFPLIPRYAVLDPAMTESLPPHLTATTGMDALTHAVEAYIGRSTTAQTRQLALHAVSLIYGNIVKAYENGSDTDARRNMSVAAYQAGIAFSKSYVGYIHAIAHSLGGLYDTPHGLANAVIMPHVLRAYGHVIDQKLKDLAVAAGICDPSQDAFCAAEAFIESIDTLNRTMGIPQYLDVIMDEDIPSLAAHAAKEANPLYPVPVIYDAKQLEQLYHTVKGDRI